MIIYPKIKSAYAIETKEKNRYIKQIYNFIRKKKLPKGLEVSLTEDVLNFTRKELKQMTYNENYYKNQNREQREVIEQQEENIKALHKENHEVKQSIYNELIVARNIGKSNDMYKNIKMLDIIEKLIDDLYFDIQEELNEELEKEYKKELADLPESN